MTHMQAQTALTAIAALTQVLTAENAALQRLDIPAANLLLAEKTAATDALTHALRAKPALPPSARGMVGELLRLATANKALLERALAAQKRVLSCIARAVPKALGDARPYAATGRTRPPPNMPPISLFARV